MTSPIDLVILGGGTAGWLTALWITSVLDPSRVRAKLVESTSIGTIGVGEASTGLLASMIMDPRFGIDEAAFFREAHATLKLGILHRDWRRPGHSYLGPIDNPGLLSPAFAPGGFPLLQAQAMAMGQPVSAAHLNGRLMAAGRGPVQPEPSGEKLPIYAYHFDAAALARFLSKLAVRRGVERLEGTVIGAERRPSGAMRALLLDDGRTIEGDFFVDCSGFARTLIRGVMGAEWRTWRDHLPLDSALAFFRQHDPLADLPLWTEARALRAGWMWSIPTSDRMGCGYVFAADFATPEQAMEELEQVLGEPIGVRSVLRFDAGRLDRVWINNCLSVGLSSGFVEPLESTSIHGALLQLQLFARELVREDFRAEDTATSDRYNARIAAILDDFRDFLTVHYVTEREDTPFWRRTRARALPDSIRPKMELWQRELPRPEHFEDGSGAVSPVLYLPVLNGLGLVPARAARDTLSQGALDGLAAETWRLADGLYREFVASALSHRDTLRRLTAAQRREMTCTA
jgi:tryptophan halogenase